MAGWIKMPLGMEVHLGPGHVVLDGLSPSPERGTADPPLFVPCLLWSQSPISATAELLLFNFGCQHQQLCMSSLHVHYRGVHLITVNLQIVKCNPDPCLLLAQFLREECIFFIVWLLAVAVIEHCWKVLMSNNIISEFIVVKSALLIVLMTACIQHNDVVILLCCNSLLFILHKIICENISFYSLKIHWAFLTIYIGAVSEDTLTNLAVTTELASVMKATISVIAAVDLAV